MNLARVEREYRELPLAVIDEPELPSRSAMSDEKMDELVASIRDVGLIQPISVARIGERYEVIAGHRRRIACGRAGLAAAPCLVYPSREAGLAAIQHAENRHREDLSPADEAIWYSQLLETVPGGDIDVLCGLVGEKRGRVESRLNLLRGDDEVFRALEAGEIGVGVAEQLNRCTDLQHRRMLLYQARTGGATVSLVSGWIAEWRHIHQPAIANMSSQAPAPAPGPILETNFFTCALCGKDSDVHLMQPVNVHTYCRQAVLADMLTLWKRRDSLIVFPNSVDEASRLIAEFDARFHLTESDDPRRI